VVGSPWAGESRGGVPCVLLFLIGRNNRSNI
jgi:hypothetical protein